jgi:L-threonylcarbamoyladenylate synthase
LEKFNAPCVCSLIYDEDEEYFPYRYMTYGSSSSEQAHWLFQRLRELDELGVKKVFVRAPSLDGVGLAVYNRLIRAAGFEVIRL